MIWKENGDISWDVWSVPGRSQKFAGVESDFVSWIDLDIPYTRRELSHQKNSCVEFANQLTETIRNVMSHPGEWP